MNSGSWNDDLGHDTARRRGSRLRLPVHQLHRAPRRRSARRRARSPAGASAGAQLPSGTTQRVNPICAASRTRSAACVVPRISPARPDFAEDRGARPDRPVAHARRDGARRSPRSAAGSSTVMPPATFTNTSSRDQVQAGALLEHGEQQRQAVLIDAAGHPPRVAVGARADQRLHLDEQRPRSFDAAEHRRARRVRRRARRGTAATGCGTACRPVPVISNTPSSLTAPKRFFTARTTRCAWCFSPSK